MLLATLKKIKLRSAIFIIIFVMGGLILAYFSKPDRGGIDRCEQIFSLDSLKDRGLELSQLWMWQPFEDPKFRLNIKPEKTDELIKYLADHGYENWIESGVQFGSFNMGGDPKLDIYYSKKEIGYHNVHFMVHDRKKNILYAIVMH